MINCLHWSERDSFGRIASVEKDFEAHRGIKEQACSRPCQRGFLPSVFALAACLVLAGCAANATKTNSVTPLISLSVSQAPPTSLTVGGSAPVSATVSNDLAAAGVDWVASCGSAPNCGSFSPSHTPSDGTAVYTAPLAVPAKSTVTVTALSATDHSKASSTTVTIISTVTDVTIIQPPPASAPSATIVSFAATVGGDPANLGVDWKATCTTIYGSVDCTPGGFHSASGELRAFTVPGPLQVPSIVGGTVTVTAFATADHSYSAQATFTVTDPLTISLTQVPPSTMLVNATAPVTATVSNDITNSGVDWLVICSNLPCGSISPSHTASGVPATYTAPPTAPAAGSGFGPGGVTITATASATGGPSVVTASTNVTIGVPISIKIAQGVPNNTIVLNRTAKLVAAVSGDTANAGVDWTVTCGTPGNCGIFSPAHAASGAATTYTAPSAIPAGGSVTITAASTTDPTKTVTETVTVTLSPPPNSLLSGQFVMLLTAKNSSNGRYVVGGVISGDGNGNITGSTLDLADAQGNASTNVGVVSPSNYSIGSDGHGQIHLTINTSAINQGGPGSFGVNGSGALTLSVSFVTPQHALLSETDSFGNATGTLDLQNLQGFAGLSGVYSLRLSGFDLSRAGAGYFLASAVTIPSPSSSSYSYITDQSDNGVVTSVPFATVQSRFVSGNGGSPGEIFVSSVNLGFPTPFNLDLWVIDATHFAVTDWRDSAANPAVILGGYLTAQPSSSAVSGTYAFTEAGATTAGQPQAAGGVFTCGSTGTLDFTPLSGGGTPTTNQAITAACTAPTSGRGLITLSGGLFTGISKFAAYPTLDQGLYLIELDGGSAGTSGPSGAGVALQQTLPAPISASAFSGKYAANFLASTTPGSENFAAQITSDGVSAISGQADVNSFNATAAPPAGTPSFGATLTGSFTAGTNGRFPLALTITPPAGQPAPNPAAINPACYIVDANTCLLLGLDSTAPGTGILLLQQTGL
jgi:hypothetical protein